MLVENAAPQRLERHMENVPSDTEDEYECQRAGEPRGYVCQISLQVEIEQRQRHDGEASGSADRCPKPARSQNQKDEHAEADANQRRQKPDPTHRRIGDDGNRSDAECDRDDETAGFAHEIAFFLLERTKLAGVGDGVTDVAQGLQQLLGVCDGWIVFDQCLLVGKAHGHLVDSGQAPERLLDGAGAERTMEPADPGANLAAVRPHRRLFTPRSECCGGSCCDAHCVPP